MLNAGATRGASFSTTKIHEENKPQGREITILGKKFDRETQHQISAYLLAASLMLGFVMHALNHSHML